MRPRRAGDSTSSPQAEPLPSGLRNQTDPDVNHLHQALHRPTGLALCRMRKPQTAPTACPKHVRTGVSVGAFSVRHRFSTASIQYGIDRQEGSAPMTGRSFSGCLFPPAFFLPGFSCRGFPAGVFLLATRTGVPGTGPASVSINRRAPPVRRKNNIGGISSAFAGGCGRPLSQLSQDEIFDAGARRGADRSRMWASEGRRPPNPWSVNRTENVEAGGR